MDLTSNEIISMLVHPYLIDSIVSLSSNWRQLHLICTTHWCPNVFQVQLRKWITPCFTYLLFTFSSIGQVWVICNPLWPLTVFSFSKLITYMFGHLYTSLLTLWSEIYMIHNLISDDLFATTIVISMGCDLWQSVSYLLWKQTIPWQSCLLMIQAWPCRAKSE